MTTKRHFNLVAEILQRQEPQDVASKVHGYWESICTEFARCFAKENPRFDRQKFINACYGME